MKILVCITHVPDTTSRIAFTENNTKFDSNGVQYIIGPYDDYALARAVELKEETGGSITVLDVGTEETEPTIRKALPIGADEAIRVNAEPTDSMFVAQQIAAVAKDGGYDMILMGRESIDFNGGMVHGMVGEILGIPSVSPVMTLELSGNTAKMTREIEGGKESLEVNMRGIMSARTKPLNVVEPQGDAVATKLQAFTLPPAKGEVTMIDADNVQELVQLLKNEAKVL